MAEPSANEKTRENLFWFQPEQAGQALANTDNDGRSIVSGRDRNQSRINKLVRLVTANIRTVIQAVPVAIGNESDRDTTFLFLPVFAGFGAVVYFNAAVEPRLSPIVSGITLLAGCYMLTQSRALIRLVLLFAMAFAIGMLCAKLETIRAATPMLGSELTTRVTGRVSAVAKDAKGGWRVTMDVISTERPQLRFGPDRVVVSARNMPRDIRVGDGLKALVRLRPQSGPVRPGNYDFAFYNYYRGIGANGFVLGVAEKVNVAPQPGFLAAVFLEISNIRQQLTHRILRNIKGEPGDIATSLVTGQRDGISDDTNAAMRLSGLSHVLSISGFHMALVAAIIIGSLRAGFAFFPSTSARYPVKKLAAIIALFGSAFYLLLSGADVAAQRSFIMLAVMLVAMIFDRAAISMRNIAIAACITLAVSPHEILGPSFQMSYSATAALIAFYGWWARRKTKHGMSRKAAQQSGLWFLPLRAVNHVSGIAMTSLVAGSASAVFAAYHFNNTAPFGLIGNALALPIVSVFVMPFAVLGLLAMPFDLDWLPFTVMGWGIELVINIAKAVASYSPSGNFGLMPVTSLILMVTGLLTLLFFSTWLRLFALPFLIMAIISMSRVQEPVLTVSEDAKLVALRTVDHQLSINRNAGSAFNLNNWQQGYGATAVIKPAENGVLTNDSQFECMDSLCTARESGGLVVAYTDDPAKTTDACDQGDIVILAFTGETTGCMSATKLVLTKRELALKGAVEVRFNDPPGSLVKGVSQPLDLAQANDALSRRLEAADVTYTIGTPSRPWNMYRIYSRAARNLPDKQPNKKTPDSSE